MPKIKGDNMFRTSKTLSLDNRIFESAIKANMAPREFIEMLFKNALKATIPDEMPLAEKEKELEEINRRAAALRMVVAEEKEKLGAAENEKQAKIKLDEAAAADRQKYIIAKQWFDTQPKEEKDRIGWRETKILAAYEEVCSKIAKRAENIMNGGVKTEEEGGV